MNTYTAEQKKETISLYIQHGTTKASEQSGVPKRTILYWVKNANVVAQARDKTDAARTELARLNAERRERIRAQLLEKMEDLLERMNKPHVDFRGKDAQMVTYPIATSSDVKNYAVSFAILLDKYRLEMGEATDRREISIEQAETRLERAIAKFEEEFVEPTV